MATGMVLLLGVGLAVAASMAASPDYQVIYRNVSGKDASAIEAVLNEKSIKMTYDAKAQTVSVSAKDEGNATMAVEAAQILSKDTQVDGLGDIDKITIGTTPDVERQRLLHQAEGELDQKLMRLDPVQSAAVSIAISPDSSFVGNETPPSASAILTLKPDETLSALQTKGIVNLIAHAVPALTTQNVTLTDQTGVPLWKDNGAGGSITDGSLMADNDKFSEQARKKVQSLLDQTLGRGKAVVTVNAELSQDLVTRHSIEHTPAIGLKTGMPLNVRDQEENYSGANPPAVGGVAGAASNLNAPSYVTGGNAAGSGGGKYSKSDTVTTYSQDLLDTQTQVAPGDIKKLSVAALVDTSVSPEAVATLKDTIAGAVGAFPGDNTRFITIHQITFDNSAQKAEATQVQAMASQALWINISRTAAVCIVALVLLFLLTRSGRQAGQPRMALAGGGANIGSLESMPDAEMAAILDRAAHSMGMEGMMEERPLTVEDVLSEMPDAENRPRRRIRVPSIEEQQDIKMESIRTMINAHPESVTLLLKGWMAEDVKVA
jgi:flagellar M-ring protein FliF